MGVRPTVAATAFIVHLVRRRDAHRRATLRNKLPRTSSSPPGGAHGAPLGAEWPAPRAGHCLRRRGRAMLSSDATAEGGSGGRRWHQHGCWRSGLAAAAGGGLGGDAGHAAHVDPGRGQDPAGQGAHAQPLVADAPVRHAARPDDVEHPGRPRLFDIEMDFLDGVLRIRTSDGGCRAVALEPKSVADFYAETMAALRSSAWTSPYDRCPWRCRCGPFARDTEHASYDAAAVACSGGSSCRPPGDHGVPLRVRRQGQPGALLLGQLDLACTRFSGRTAPPHPVACPTARTG